MKFYYIGFNANNAICNENFFDGSITIYPNGEKGNMFFSDRALDDITSDNFLRKYKNFIIKKTKVINNKYSGSKFIIFNDRVKKLCEDINGVEFIYSNNKNISLDLNNKFVVRDFVKNIVPVLDYFFVDKNQLDYEKLKQMMGSDKFVIQAAHGSGGESTYLIESEDINSIITNKNIKYCVSKYQKHIPLNSTLIIGKKDVLQLPCSVQLILLTENKFKYVGADFVYIKKLKSNILDKLYRYSHKIAVLLQAKGYRGILGIDFILCENGKLFFMEINPRFQASSFLISCYLEKNFNTSIAELHYSAITGKNIDQIHLKDINHSFVNCNQNQLFQNLKNYSIISKGYFVENKYSVYRKVFERSIYEEDIFEKI